MSRFQKFTFLAVLVLGVWAHGHELRQIQRQRTQLDIQLQRLVRQDAQVQQARRQREDLQEELEITEQAVATLHANEAAAAASLGSAWRNRVHRLRQMLDAAPGQKIPELALLEPKDWIEVAQKFSVETDASTDSSLLSVLKDLGDNLSQGSDPTAPVSAAFSALRKKARDKFANKVQDALRRFLQASNDELPADILQLAPYLDAPAGAEMLQRYKMTRSGKLGAKDEMLVGEKSAPDEPRDGLLSLGLNRSSAHPSLPLNAHDRLEQAASDFGKDAEAVDFGKSLGEFFDPAFKENLKLSQKQFAEANGGRMPADLFELRPYLKNFDATKLAEAARPLFAAATFALFHDGKLPSASAQLKPYLDKPVDIDAVLRASKLGADGHSINFEFKAE